MKNGEVEVLPMTAIDEITLSTPDKLLSGKAVLEVLERRVPQVLKPGELLAKDVDFLMVCLRLVSFGSTTSIQYNHGCKGEESHDHEYEIKIDKMVSTVAQIDPTVIDREYSFTCDNGQTVRFKPFTYSSVVKFHELQALSKGEPSVDILEKLVIETLAHAIADVDGVTNEAQITEWVAAIPLGMKKQLETHIQLTSEWGVNSIVTETCKDCGDTISIPMSFNPVGFFM